MSRALALLLVVAAGCAPSTAPDDDARPKAVATISILSDFVAAVAGDRIDVEPIVHVGGDPHTYEPVPSDPRRVAEADVVFRNGLGLERWLDRLIEGSRVVTLTEGLDATITQTGQYSGDPDPHLWMDPHLARGYVANARDALVELDPAGAQTYRDNADAYLRELDELDAWISEQVGTIPAPNRKLVTTHDAFRYFGQRYGLDVVGTIWSISTEREPSAEEVARLVDDVKAHAVPTVFIETTVNPRIMQRVARDAGVEVGEPLYGDSVGEPGSGADSYIGMMRANVRAIVSGLGGRTRG
ncbi:MAG TPA: metal ABC transporter substrate-binding protein [Actinomycetota bacterium]|nr:metal ABC transporter substrate-binding protein [Actinomycetota bacterium]